MYSGPDLITQLNHLKGIGFNAFVDSNKEHTDKLNDIQGVGFATGTDDLNSIKDNTNKIKNLVGATL